MWHAAERVAHDAGQQLIAERFQLHGLQALVAVQELQMLVVLLAEPLARQQDTMEGDAGVLDRTPALWRTPRTSGSRSDSHADTNASR